MSSERTLVMISHHARLVSERVDCDWVGHLQLVGTQQLLIGGGAAGHGDGRAAGDDDGSAGQDVCGHQAHAVGHGSQVGCVAQTCAGAQALADWKRLLNMKEKNNTYLNSSSILS